MGILLIGGSGRTGKVFLSEALSNGHAVTALVRDPTSLTPQPKLTLVQGSPLSPPDIEQAIQRTSSQDPITSIVVTLASVRGSDNPFSKPISPPRLMADAAANLVVAMQQHPEIHKIVVLSAWGVAESYLEMPFAFRWLFHYSGLARAFEDHDALDMEIKASGVRFVLVRPARLTETGKKPIKEHGNTGQGLGLMSQISRASVATFLLGAVESDQWDMQTPVICE